MKVIICLDENGGMLFNHRRQSKDRLVVDDMVRFVGNGVLRCNAYSRPLLEESGAIFVVSEDFLEKAEVWDYCFVEDQGLLQYKDNISQLLVYHWNRSYPADLYLDLDIEAEGFMLVERAEFVGSSHEKITREVYVK